MGDWSTEKDCCWRLTFRQPVQKPSSESSNSLEYFERELFFEFFTFSYEVVGKRYITVWKKLKTRNLVKPIVALKARCYYGLVWTVFLRNIWQRQKFPVLSIIIYIRHAFRYNGNVGFTMQIIQIMQAWHDLNYLFIHLLVPKRLQFDATW